MDIAYTSEAQYHQDLLDILGKPDPEPEYNALFTPKPDYMNSETGTRPGKKNRLPKFKGWKI